MVKFSDQRKDKETILNLLFAYLAFPLTKLLARFERIKPNHVSFVVLLLFILSAYLFLSADNANYWFACFIFMLGSILDTVDGALARMTKRTSQVGRMIDLAIDRFGIGIILISLCWNYTDYYEGSVNVVWAVSFTFYLLLSVSTIIQIFHKPINVHKLDEMKISGIRRSFYHRGISFPPISDFEIVFVLLAIMPLTEYFLQGMIIGILLFILRYFIEYLIFWK